MSENKTTTPKYVGEGISVWVNQTKEGETYLTVQLFGKNGLRISCFKHKPKIKEEKILEA